MRSFVTAIAASLACLAAAVPAARAHPHVQVETATRVLFNAEGLIVGLEQAWTFDEFYSSYATQGLDANRDGVFSREELAELTKVNVENLGQQKFFTVMRHERRYVSFAGVREAYSEVADGKLTLRFTVPLVTPFRPAGRPVTVEIYDPEYFVAFAPAEGEPMRLAGAPAACKLDYTPPRGGDRPVSSLSESFFQALGSSSNFGQQYAGKFTVICP